MSAQSTGRVVLVNGASGGLGPAVVRGFADEGARLILTGQTAEQVEATARDLELDAAKTLAACRRE
jgi:NADP-dependent 3-hydroxy acid dehydrogenase YdfG